AVQFTDPWGTDFAYVGRRATGTQAGDYLISGPGWHGTAPPGVTPIGSPNNTVLLIGRTLVESEGDLATAYGLAKQVQVTPLRRWRPGHERAVGMASLAAATVAEGSRLVGRGTSPEAAPRVIAPKLAAPWRSGHP